MSFTLEAKKTEKGVAQPEARIVAELVKLGEIHFPDDSLQRSNIDIKREQYVGKSAPKTELSKKSNWEKYYLLCVLCIDHLKIHTVLLPRDALSYFYQVFGLTVTGGEELLLHRAYTRLRDYCDPKTGLAALRTWT